MIHCFETLPAYLHVQPLSCNPDVVIPRLDVKADEIASFVQQKANEPWLWLVMGTHTRQVQSRALARPPEGDHPCRSGFNPTRVLVKDL